MASFLDTRYGKHCIASLVDLKLSNVYKDTYLLDAGVGVGIEVNINGFLNLSTPTIQGPCPQIIQTIDGVRVSMGQD